MTSRVLAVRNGTLGDLKLWFGQASTVTSVATFYPTDDGTATGIPLFSMIYHVLATAQNNAADAVTLPLAALKSISADRTTVKVSAVVGMTLLALGATLGAAPDGTVVHCIILGV